MEAVRSLSALPPVLRWRRATLQARWFKPVVFVACLAPLATLVWRAATVQLGPNPEQTLIWTTGLWTLRWLFVTLAITPARSLTGWAELARLRRMFGLFAFSYGLLHFTCYVWLVNGFSAAAVVKDVAKHPFVLAGMAALLLMVPLAATSTNGMIKRLGAARWKALHRLVYLIGVIAVFHYWWGKLAKNNTADPKIYAAILAVLLLYRVARSWRVRRRQARGPRVPAET